MKLEKRLVQAVPWTIIDGLFNLLYAIGMVVLVGRFLSPAQLGLAAVALAVSQFTDASYSSGLHEAVVRATSGHTGQSDSAHTLAILFGVAGLVLGWLLAYPLAVIYGDMSIFPLTLAASLTIPINALFLIPQALLTRKMRTKVLTSRIMIAKVFSAATFVLSIAFFSANAWSIILSTLASSLGSLGALFMQTKRWPKLRFRTDEMKEILHYSVVSSSATFCWISTGRGYLLLFGYFHGMAALGIFQFALRLVDELASLLQVTVFRVGLSYFAGLNRTKADMTQSFLAGTKLLNTLAVPIYAGLMAVSPVLVPLVFGARWNDAVPVIWITALSWILVFPRILIPTVLRAQGCPSYNLKFSLIEMGTAFTFALVTAFMAPIAGVIGWAVARVANVPFQFKVIRDKLGVSPTDQVRQTLPALLASMAMLVVVHIFLLSTSGFSPWLRLFSAALIGSVTYVALVFMADPTLIPMFKKILKTA